MKAPFHKRYNKLENVVKKVNSKHLVLLEQTKCEDIEQLDSMMDYVLGKGGEGVMLKDPESIYEERRSDKLLKVKKFDQGECIVLGKENGSGRCENMMGKIMVREEGTGHEFKIGSGFTDAQRKSPPKKGLRITFKY
jgi:DNA ligase-1